MADIWDFARIYFKEDTEFQGFCFTIFLYLISALDVDGQDTLKDHVIGLGMAYMEASNERKEFYWVNPNSPTIVDWRGWISILSKTKGKKGEGKGFFFFPCLSSFLIK